MWMDGWVRPDRVGGYGLGCQDPSRPPAQQLTEEPFSRSPVVLPMLLRSIGTKGAVPGRRTLRFCSFVSSSFALDLIGVTHAM